MAENLNGGCNGDVGGGTLTGEDLLLRRLRGLDVGAL